VAIHILADQTGQADIDQRPLRAVWSSWQGLLVSLNLPLDISAGV
jgi:hypothetical protein